MCRGGKHKPGWGWRGRAGLYRNGGGGAAYYIKGGVDNSKCSAGNGGGSRCFSSSFPSSSQLPFQHLEENDYCCHAATATYRQFHALRCGHQEGGREMKALKVRAAPSKHSLITSCYLEPCKDLYRNTTTANMAARHTKTTNQSRIQSRTPESSPLANSPITDQQKPSLRVQRLFSLPCFAAEPLSHHQPWESGAPQNCLTPLLEPTKPLYISPAPLLTPRQLC